MHARRAGGGSARSTSEQEDPDYQSGQRGSSGRTEGRVPCERASRHRPTDPPTAARKRKTSDCLSTGGRQRAKCELADLPLIKRASRSSCPARETRAEGGPHGSSDEKGASGGATTRLEDVRRRAQQDKPVPYRAVGPDFFSLSTLCICPAGPWSYLWQDQEAGVMGER